MPQIFLLNMQSHQSSVTVFLFAKHIIHAFTFYTCRSPRWICPVGIEYENKELKLKRQRKKIYFLIWQRRRGIKENGRQLQRKEVFCLGEYKIIFLICFNNLGHHLGKGQILESEQEKHTKQDTLHYIFQRQLTYPMEIQDIWANKVKF